MMYCFVLWKIELENLIVQISSLMLESCFIRANKQWVKYQFVTIKKIFPFFYTQFQPNKHIIGEEE